MVASTCSTATWPPPATAQAHALPNITALAPEESALRMSRPLRIPPQAYLIPPKFLDDRARFS